MYCNHCGTPIPQNARECPNCHAPVAVPPGTLPSFDAPTVMLDNTPAPNMPPVQAPPPAKKKMKPVVIVVIVLAVLMVCCLVAVLAVILLKPDWLPFELPGLGGGGRQSSDYLVAYLQGEDEYDLTWVHGKTEDMLYEEAILDLNYNSFYFIADAGIESYLWNQVDFLSTDRGKLLVRMMDGDDTVVSVRDLKKETDVELFSSSNNFTGYVLEDGTFVFIENRAESVRAYVSDGKSEAERVLKADQIDYLPALNSFLTTEIDEEEMTFTLFDLKGNETITLYQGDLLANWVIAQDGSLMVIAAETEDGMQVQVINTASGEILSTNDAYSNVAGLFAAPQGSLVYFYGEDEDGFLSLEATINGVDWTHVTDGAKKLAAVTNPDDDRMAYLSTDEEDTTTLYVVDIKTGENQEVMNSDDVLNLMSETGLADTFFVSEVMDDETTLYRCSFRGGGPLPVLEDVEADISYLNGLNRVMILSLYDDVDNTSSLWVMPEKAEEGFMLVEDWYSVYTVAMSPDGTSMIFNGIEDSGDDPVLYSIDVAEDADPVEIDDDFDSVWNAFLTSDGKSLLYNVQTGDRYDDFEVRRVDLSAREPETETLYEEARILATGWTTLDYENYWYAYTVYPTQGSGVSRLGIGQTANGSLGGDVYEARFKISLEADKLYRIVVKAAEAVNPAIYLYDKDGMQLSYKNDYVNAEESMFIAPSVSGAFEIGISDWNYGSTSSKFTIELIAVPAQVLAPGNIGSDELTDADQYQFGDQTQYMRFFIIPAAAGDSLSITVDGFGADLPYAVNLTDAYYTYQTGTYGYGYASTLYYTAYADARYILVITDDSSFYGMSMDFSKDHSFTVDVSK